jgi:KaiC/GvpD/RAD55 family RecA-like ATPase
MVVQHVNRDRFSPFALALLETIQEYYEADLEAPKVDMDVLSLKLDRRFKDIPRHQGKMRDKLEEVLSVNTSTTNVMQEVIEQKRAEVGTLLADSLLAQDKEQIQHYLTEYEQLTDIAVLESGAEEEYQGATLDDIAERFNNVGVYNLAPKALAKRIPAGLRPGHAVFIAARPERGKTLFGITVTSGLLQQGAKVLYIGNEDPIDDLILRLLSNLSGMSADQMMENKEEAMERAKASNYENCVFASLTPGTLYEIEALVRKHKPDAVVVDQMRNIRAKTENNTQRLEVVAQEMRNMARRHNFLAIQLTQVGDSGRDVLVLNDGDIDGSNTGIPGACDVIVMVGSNDDYELRDLRQVTLAKNKRGGIHENFTVSVDRELSRVITYAPN